MALTLVGADGAVEGTSAVAGDTAALVNAAITGGPTKPEFLSTMEMVYEVPLVRPLMVQVVAEGPKLVQPEEPTVFGKYVTV